MQDQSRIRLVRILVEMVDTVRVEQRRPALDAVNFITLVKEQFGEVGAVLTRDPGDEGSLLLANDAIPCSRVDKPGR